MAMNIPPRKKDKSYIDTPKMGRKLCIREGSPKALSCFEVPSHKVVARMHSIEKHERSKDGCLFSRMI
jgi:hypothetical protein